MKTRNGFVSNSSSSSFIISGILVPANTINELMGNELSEIESGKIGYTQALKKLFSVDLSVITNYNNTQLVVGKILPGYIDGGDITEIKELSINDKQLLVDQLNRLNIVDTLGVNDIKTYVQYLEGG